MTFSMSELQQTNITINQVFNYTTSNFPLPLTFLMYLMNIPQEEENELDALQSAKELEEEKKKEKERQAKLVGILMPYILFCFHFYI